MTYHDSLDADELALLATVIAIVFAKKLTLDQTNVYGNFLVAVGGIMLVIAALEDARKAKDEDKDADTRKKLQDMQQQLDQLLAQAKTGEADECARSPSKL